MLIHKLLFGTYSSVLNTEMSSFQGVGIKEFHYKSKHHPLECCIYIDKVTG